MVLNRKKCTPSIFKSSFTNQLDISAFNSIKRWNYSHMSSNCNYNPALKITIMILKCVTSSLSVSINLCNLKLSRITLSSSLHLLILPRFLTCIHLNRTTEITFATWWYLFFQLWNSEFKALLFSPWLDSIIRAERGKGEEWSNLMAMAITPLFGMCSHCSA